MFDTICSWFSQLLWRFNRINYPGGGTDLFWLDTFCIPNEDLEDAEADKIATKKLRIGSINKMDLIYAKASEVLVLDRELQSVDGGVQPTPMLGEGLFHSCFQVFVGPSDDRRAQTLAYAFGSTWYASSPDIPKY